MYDGFDQKVKSEVIVISNLNNYKLKGSYKYYDDWRMRWQKKEESQNKSEEEINAEIKEEIKRNTDKLKEESMKRDYKIDNEKEKELESIFKQIKLKINFDSKPKILRDGKFYTISQGYLFIYDNRFFNKLYEIKLEKNINYTSVIQLDNQDLILFYESEINVYRLINGKFVFVQKINDNKAGYKMQMAHKGCRAYPKTYSSLFIKNISNNRFILVSNYGYKIYSLNEKNEYSISLLEIYHNGLQTIIELDKDNFIFLSQIECGDSLGGPAHNVLTIDKIKLREISKSEKKKKLEIFKERDYYEDEESYFGFRNKKPVKKISEKEVENVIESLKYTHIEQELLDYSTYGSYHYFKGNAILKNKYFIVAIDYNILIFDISSGKILERYEILLYGKNSLFKSDLNLQKWNNNKDNQFLINLAGNIILFELLNECELKIINQIYFKDINYLKQLNEKSNKFYDDSIREFSVYDDEDDEDDEDDDYYNSKDKNIGLSVSIFY